MRRIIDKRKKEKFMIDDAYLNSQARICGWKATIVYLSLCRHVNKSQECFPGIKLMSEELSVCRDTIIAGLKDLQKHNVIQIEKNRANKGIWQNNNYILLDKSVWKNNQVDKSDLVNQVDKSVKPSRRHRINQVDDIDSKETHIKETQLRKHNLQLESCKEIPIIIDLFKNINPSYQKLFGNKTQRSCVARLLKQYGEKELTRVINALPDIITRPYAPKITTPYQLEEKMGQLIAFVKSEQNKNIKNITIKV